jgi:hypothetical protein
VGVVSQGDGGGVGEGCGVERETGVPLQGLP